MIDYPIDIVVPWVVGSDPAWRAERAKYRPVFSLLTMVYISGALPGPEEAEKA